MSRWWRRLCRWWQDPARARMRRARKELERLFSDRPELLRGTSLQTKHRQRVQVLDTEEVPFRVIFGIVRHPRPYSFSKQVHEVLEIWCYSVEEGKVERVRGHNLTRMRGEDGDPSGEGVH